MSEKMSKEELTRLFEIGRTDNGYEYVIRNEKYVSEITPDVLASYVDVVSDTMQRIAELVEEGKVCAEDINVINNQIDEEYPEKDEKEKILFIVMRARSQGIIDDYFEKCIQKFTALKDWPVNSATHLLLERPAVMSYILAAMDVYANGFVDDAERYYGTGAYWLLRQVLTRDPRTTHMGYEPCDQI